MDFVQFIYVHNRIPIALVLPCDQNISFSYRQHQDFPTSHLVKPFIPVGKIIACCGAWLKRWRCFVSLAAWYCMYLERCFLWQKDGFGKWGGMRTERERERVLWDGAPWLTLAHVTKKDLEHENSRIIYFKYIFTIENTATEDSWGSLWRMLKSWIHHSLALRLWFRQQAVSSAATDTREDETSSSSYCQMIPDYLTSWWLGRVAPLLGSHLFLCCISVFPVPALGPDITPLPSVSVSSCTHFKTHTWQHIDTELKPRCAHLHSCFPG